MMIEKGLDGENVSEAATLTGGEQQTTSSSTVNHHHQTTNHSALSVGDALPDEEWKPFDSEENKDYSGLRINQNWKLEDEEDADEDADNDDTQKKVRLYCFILSALLLNSHITLRRVKEEL